MSSIARSTTGTRPPSRQARQQRDVAIPLTRLSPPRLPRATIARARLHEALTTAVERPLTLLVAPAGFGKTVLLSSWLDGGSLSARTAWFTVDHADDDAVRFWAGVLTAVQRSGAAPRSARLVAPTRGFDEEFLASLMNELSAADEPLILVLDDFDAIGDDAVLEGVDYVLRHAPAQLHVVVATRSDPRLSLGRLRVRRDLTELRAAALAFTDDEAVALLAASGVELAGGDVATLVARTEGWAAGLALAAMSLEGALDPAGQVARFAGDDRAVADFLASEVIEQIHPDVRDFLLQVSVVDEVCPALAEELTGRADAGETLEELVRTNAFVVALDANHGWYRCHNLFSQFLRSELFRRGDSEVLALHRRAAVWFAANGRPLEAIRHALTAEDWSLATALVSEHWLDALLDGRATRFGQMLTRLPAGAADDDPQLALACAACHLELGQAAEADRYLELARRSGGADLAGEAFVEGLAIVTLSRARIYGDVDEAVASARTLLTTSGYAPRARTRPRRRALALLLLGEAEMWTGRPREARRHLRSALALVREAGEDYLVLSCLAQLALLEVFQGRLRPAVELGQEAIGLARARGTVGDRAVGPAYLAVAAAELEWNDPAAERSIRQASAATADAGGALNLAVALTDARIRARDGGPTGARRGLELLEATLDGSDAARLPSFLEERVRGTLAFLSLGVGEAAEAESWLQGPRGSAYLRVVDARLALANGAPAPALELLSGVASGSDTYLGTRIEAAVLASVAHRARLEPELAAQALEHALELADPDGFRWRFLLAGPPLQELLLRQVRFGTAHRALVEQLLVDADGGPASGAARAPARQLLDPLTEREETVLRYLPTLLSNAEIASELYVSINTVKAHVKSIYRKLGTSRRKDAVVRARELRLL